MKLKKSDNYCLGLPLIIWTGKTFMHLIPVFMLVQNVNRGNDYPDIMKESVNSLFVDFEFSY